MSAAAADEQNPRGTRFDAQGDGIEHPAAAGSKRFRTHTRLPRPFGETLGALLNSLDILLKDISLSLGNLRSGNLPIRLGSEHGQKWQVLDSMVATGGLEPPTPAL